MEVERRGGRGRGGASLGKKRGGVGGVGWEGGNGRKGGGKGGNPYVPESRLRFRVHAVRSRNCTITNEREPEILCRYVYSLKAAQVAYNKAGLPS